MENFIQSLTSEQLSTLGKDNINRMLSHININGLKMKTSIFIDRLKEVGTAIPSRDVIDFKNLIADSNINWVFIYETILKISDGDEYIMSFIKLDSIKFITEEEFNLMLNKSLQTISGMTLYDLEKRKLIISLSNDDHLILSKNNITNHDVGYIE